MNTNYARKWESMSAIPRPHVEEKVKVKVRTKGWITRGEKIIYSFIIASIIAVALYIVSFASANDSLNREIQAMETKIAEQQLENEALLYEKKELSKPERIIKIAKENGLKVDTKVKSAQAIQNN